MMSSAPPLTDKESTPLLFSPKGGGHLDPAYENPANGPQRRRGGPQAPVRQIIPLVFNCFHSYYVECTRQAFPLTYLQFSSLGGSTFLCK
jgi:hypothetical protein